MLALHQTHGIDTATGSERRLASITAPTRLRLQRAACLRLAQGCAWITRTGSRADVILQAGQSLCLPRGNGWVVEPLGAKAVELAWSDAAGGATSCMPWPETVATGSV
jgi:hypothetical protein